MDYKIQVDSPQEAALLTQFDQDGFAMWDKRLLERNGYSIGFNHFMAENSVQWGHNAGLNSGNGQFEGRMPAELFLALGSEKGPFKGDPDWFKDDKKFYRYLREHPEHDGRPGKHNAKGEKFLPR